MEDEKGPSNKEYLHSLRLTKTPIYSQNVLDAFFAQELLHYLGSKTPKADPALSTWLAAILAPPPAVVPSGEAQPTATDLTLGTLPLLVQHRRGAEFCL